MLCLCRVSGSVWRSALASENLKQTPLYDIHLSADAKMGAFAGYSMPLFYPLGLVKEHLHTREEAGLFDISHMVHIEVEGKEASRFISRMCPYSAADQEIGNCRYTFFLTENAGIIDDLIVTRLGEQRYLIVANAGCAEKDIAHVQEHAAAFDVTVTIRARAFLALQGPKAEAVLVDLGIDVTPLAFMEAMEIGERFISRTGYTGEDGFEIALPVDQAGTFAKQLLANESVELIGLGARDSLRLEAGLSLYGQDLDETISPHEAGLLWAIPKPLRDGGPFIGAESLAAKIAEGRKRKRVGLKPKQKIPVRAGCALTDGEDKPIGTITSGGFGPSIDYPVALGLVDAASGNNGILAEVRGRKIEMELATLPFVTHGYKR